MSITAAEANRIKQAPAVEGVLPAVLGRWSARAFAPRPVAEADLTRIFEATRWAASAYNEQPWRFLVGFAGDDTHRKLAASLIEFNRAWASSAPVLILGLAKRTFTHNDTPNDWAMYDLGAATATLTIQAAALGLTTHTMAGYDHQGARTTLGIPDDYLTGAVIALGHQGEPEQLGHEKLLELETSARTRKPLEELVFTSWGKPAQLG